LREIIIAAFLLLVVLILAFVLDGWTREMRADNERDVFREWVAKSDLPHKRWVDYECYPENNKIKCHGLKRGSDK
jgi:hypothetical protein